MKRPTRPALSRAYIAGVALSLIDTLGPARFSMRKLGAELGADPMAVYHYFDDQEALFDAVAELLFDETDTGSLPWDGPWRELLEATYRRLRDTLLAHPHAVPIFASRPVRSAPAIAVGDRTITILRDAGFSPGLALQVTRALRDFTVGHAMAIAAVRLGAQRRSKKPAAGAPDYNLLAESADAAGIEEHFDLGLRAMLDGFDAIVTS
ncbi:TetR/AcrR family transcriptional regulator [Nonomuraea sp. NPDC050536]|uniref:TetR/AcrR family transcriptional regulator n=1 Tax=Nonomuraea sp. NPDC050536 TaxID=3364366 RepID=UPI0037C9A979